MTEARLIPNAFRRWLPPAYKEWDIRTQRRGQLVLLLAWLYCVAGVGLSLNHASEERYVFAGLTAVLTLVMLAVPSVFKRTGNFHVVGHLVAGSFLVIVMTVVWVLGSIDRPILMLLGLSPMSATLFAGWRVGCKWMLVSVCLLVSLYSLYLLQVLTAPTLPHGFSVLMHTVIALLALLLSTAMACAQDYLMEVTSQEALAAEQEAQSALTIERTRRALLANISHEFRTPLNIILGYQDILNDMDPTPEQEELLSRIEYAARQQLALVNDFLDFSKIASGKLAVRLQPFQLRALLSSLLTSLAPLKASEDIQLQQDVADDVPDTLMGDPDRITQVLTNLLGNALKFTDAGEVQLQVTHRGQQGDRILLHFSVSDTGPGMTVEECSHVFQPFTQAHHSRGGTGLGLAISQQLVTSMGGSIGVESTPGQGSIFWCTIPLDKH